MHVMKLGKGGASRIIAHVKRDRETLTESKIDWSKTKENVTLIEFDQKRFSELEALAKRKDAVVLTDTVLTLPKELKYSSRKRQTEFFETALEKMKEHIKGEPVCAVIHFDETTPHLHYASAPITVDGRLCAKELINRAMLKTLHGTVEEHVRSKGFEVRLQEENEELRQMQHDLGYSTKSMPEYRKDAFRESMEAQYDRETQKSIEYHQTAMKHGKKSVKRRKGESKEEYKARKTEMVEVPRMNYDALMRLNFDRETVRKGAEAELLLEEAKSRETAIEGEIRQSERLERVYKQKHESIDKTVAQLSEKIATEMRNDLLSELRDFCKGKKLDNGENVMSAFVKHREAQIKPQEKPQKAKVKSHEWER